MKEELWRKYKGTTAEELCAAIRELWLAKAQNYVRMFNEIPNRLIKEIATIYASNLEVRPEANRWPPNGRQELKDLEKFLDKQPYGDHFSDDLLEEELSWRNPDAPLSDYIEADKKRDALIKKYSLTERIQ